MCIGHGIGDVDEHSAGKSTSKLLLYGLATSLFSAAGLALLAFKIRARAQTKGLLETGIEATATLRFKRKTKDRGPEGGGDILEFDVEFPVAESALFKKTFKVSQKMYEKYDSTIATAESARSTMSVHYLEKDPQFCMLSEEFLEKDAGSWVFVQNGCIVGPIEIVSVLAGLAAAVGMSASWAGPLTMVGFLVGIALSAVWTLPILLYPPLKDLKQLPQFACCPACCRGPEGKVDKANPIQAVAEPSPVPVKAIAMALSPVVQPS
jgi:hypothetical protein